MNSTLLKNRTRTHLEVVANPEPKFLSDVEVHLRALAHKAEQDAEHARDNCMLTGRMIFPAQLASRYREEVKALYKTPAPPRQIPDTYWSRRRTQIILALVCFVAAAAVLGWGLAQ